MEAHTTQVQAGPQIFAAKGRSRHRAMRVGLLIGAALIVAWVAALALGAFGGFETLPQVNLNSDEPKQEAVTPEPAAAVTPTAKATETSAQEQAQGPTGGGTTPVRKPKPAPAPAPTTKPSGKPDGAGSTDGTGKPIGTPGNGSGGGNAGGNGNANGHLK